MKQTSLVQSRLTVRRNMKPWVAAAPLASWCLAIFVMSSVPGNKYPQVRWEHADKLVHLCLYFWVGVFAWIFFSARGSGAFSALTFGILYGLSDEIHQLWVPQRSFSLLDWAADSLGVLIGVYAILALHRRHLNRNKNQLNQTTDSPERMEAS